MNLTKHANDANHTGQRPEHQSPGPGPHSPRPTPLHPSAATDARVAPGGLAVSWTSSLGPGDAIDRVVADYDARKPMFAFAEALLPRLVACARLDEALACAAAILAVSVILCAPESSNPRKIPGKASTLLIWLG